MRTISLLFAVCIVCHTGWASDVNDSEIPAAGGVSTYVFMPEQSTLVQTGGIAGVHWTYSLKGKFQLSVDFNAGHASFVSVDANATDDSPYKRTVDPNEVFNMTKLLGTVISDTILVFTGKDTSGSDILIVAILDNDLVNLVGKTIPPAGSADFFIFNMDAVARRKYGGGTGEPNDPYLIYTAEQMNTLGAEPNDWNKHFKLMADIDLSKYTGTSFNIIGYWRAWNDKKPFIGVFDGNAKKISNFTYNSIIENNIGLFGYIDEPNTLIKNVGLISPVVKGATVNYVGSLLGHLGCGNIERCYTQDGTISGHYLVGGLVGYNSVGSIKDCYAVCTVRGISGVGGLVGHFSGRDLFAPNLGATISRCYSSGSIIGDDDVGGLIGGSGLGGSIKDCYSSASVTGNLYIGGLIGSSLNASRIVRCYSTGAVYGQVLFGGLVGYSRWTDAIGSFWDIETSGLTGSSTGQGKTTSELQTMDTFIEAGWDFVGEVKNGTEDIWRINEGKDYPRLSWEVIEVNSP